MRTSFVVLAIGLFAQAVSAIPSIPQSPSTGIAATFPVAELRLDTAARARIPPSAGISTSTSRSKAPRQASSTLVAICGDLNCQTCSELPVENILFLDECTGVGEYFSTALINPGNTSLPFTISVGVDFCEENIPFPAQNTCFNVIGGNFNSFFEADGASF
ncbi:hypothetical protein C8Q70DRAFT_613343 [Cubamyces menziesii]|uniref:Uncharacterized protein n=1 Tax=Trametes cubensis TaxID=1111947 RepID=A0AAD7TFZ6_9APHY|nr:hypothetical protein C8Q70DRAFT_613343 [Cubamyces menziesii]KAJ8455519.1 hypothetical protein ONZ51_g12426 [Trametes cubensis]